jgi:hypothetical protein
MKNDINTEIETTHNTALTLEQIKMTDLGQGFLSRETSGIVTYYVSQKHGSLGIYCLSPSSQSGSQYIAQ